MTKVTAQMSVSLDGFYTGPRDTRDPKDMSGWMRGPEAPGFFRVTRWAVDAMAWRERQGFAGGEQSINSEIIEETFAAAGAYVMGRRMFDAGEVPWGEEPPFRAPVFVVTHRSREVLERQGGTSFTFVTDGLERAIALARDAAGGKNVAVAGGGELVRQVLTAGLLDELELHIAPVLLGDGQRLFDASLGLGADDGIELVADPGRRGARGHPHSLHRHRAVEAGAGRSRRQRRAGRREERAVKYMLLIYGNEEAFSSVGAEAFAEIVRETDALNQELFESGELVGAYGVADQVNAKMVRVAGGTPVVTDGPFAEAKEYLGSFTILDCDSLERALEIAARNPSARYWGIEVRPLMHEANVEP